MHFVSPNFSWMSSLMVKDTLWIILTILSGEVCTVAYNNASHFPGQHKHALFCSVSVEGTEVFGIILLVKISSPWMGVISNHTCPVMMSSLPFPKDYLPLVPSCEWKFKLRVQFYWTSAFKSLNYHFIALVEH